MKETNKIASASSPESLKGDLVSLTESARQPHLLTSNDKDNVAVKFSDGECIHELIEVQAARSPLAIAVVHGEEQLSYRELDERANAVAERLRRVGVGPDKLVGIYVERTLAMVVGMLGVLKAGGAYVPLDPKYPAARLAFMLEDAQPVAVVTQQNLREQLPAHRGQVVCVDDEAEADTGAPPMVGQRPQAHHLAYVIYTSGSTGQPKGVAIEHRNAVNFIYWARSVFSDAELAGVLAATSICFDLSVFELFVTLSWGGKVILAENALELPRLAAKAQVTLINTVPSAMAELVRSGSVPAGVQVVNLAGEPLATALVDQIYALKHIRKVHDLYGPTETTTYSTFTLRQPGAKATIGRPLANTQVYVLDEHRQPVPAGVAGELYIGGAGVARGYLNRPELTAEKFLADPFGQEPGGRIYKTGDLVRCQPDGQLEFIGRIDQQVKIRGYRIELGEIEAVLRQHPAVREAVVVARANAAGEKELVAYLTGSAVPAVGELRAHLLKTLPDYMVPVAFVTLAALPLTPNGKIDRQALPAPAGERFARPTEAPATATEQKLARLWRELLGVEKIGRQDNYFELGGHSLLAVRMIFRLRDEFGVELPVKAIAAHPTIAALSLVVEAAGQTAVNRLRPEAAEARRQASFSQEQLWFLDQLEPGSVVYNVPLSLRLRGALNREALEQSLNHVFRRHEVLRTTFVAEQGAPVPVVAAELKLELTPVDLTHLQATERESEVQRRLQSAAASPFDLSRGPLVRAELFGLGPAEHVLLVVIHHIVFDGWSVDVLLRELTAGYTAFSAGHAPDLPDLPVQYADFAAWQRRQLNPETVEHHLNYWRQQLAQTPTTLDLPVDKMRPLVADQRGAQQSFTLPTELTVGLRKLGQQNDCTPFVILLAAFHVLLYWSARQEQILIGVPFAGRTGSEVENLIGFFVNSLPVKADFSQQPSFVQLLRQVRDNLWAAQEHQNFPFEQLVKNLQPARELNRNPFFQAAFVFEILSPVLSNPIDGIVWALEQVRTNTAKFDLTLTIQEDDGCLKGIWEYAAGIFDGSTMARMVECYQVLLNSIVTSPEQRVLELAILTEGEHEKMLVKWNETRRDYPQDKCVHELFEAQVAKRAGAAAVEWTGGRLTYGELNERANQLAHHLRTFGVGVETLVGVLVSRSVDYVVSTLGILKAGAAYVPLDLDYPVERLAFMLEDSGVKVVVVDQALPEDLKSRGITIINLVADASLIQSYAKHNPDNVTTVGHLAYVIYTSGSTGQPKGVQIEHRGLVNLCFWHQNFYAVEPVDRATWIASPAFDASVWELWPYLTVGASVHIPDMESRLSPVNLWQWLAKKRITLCFMPTPLAEACLAVTQPADLALRTLLVGGDQLRQIPCGAMSYKLVNNYGPTENTVVSTCWVVETDSDGLPPIGRPIANTTAYILDAAMRPVPIGVAGELHVGGAGLARGYLNRPELTTEKFVANPFSIEPGARLYRTGDLCRYRADGNIEFLGRLDQQVKVRGYRIELGEIEAALNLHPALRETVVVARANTADEKELVAYLVAHEKLQPTVAELRAFLRKKLPDYMVPVVFVILPTLPRTPNGKIDRKALPTPGKNRLVSDAQFMAPGAPAEMALAAIWQELLGVERVGIHDNFFALGGHSLMVVKMVNEIRRQMNFDLQIWTLFQHPTIFELAKVLPIQKNMERKPELIQLQAGHSGPEFFFLIDEGSLGLLKLSHFLDDDLRLYASVVPIPESTLGAATKGQFSALPRMEDWAAKHVALIKSRQTTGPLLLAGHCFGGMLAFEVAQQLQAAGIKVEAVLLLDTWMITPTFWWEKKAWLREHLGKLLKQGPQYLWRKSWRRIKLEKRERASKLEMATHDDFNLHIPWAIIARIYRHAITGYRPKPLSSRGILFVSQDDWLSNAYRPLDDSLGASRLFTGGVEVINVPGNHVTVLSETHLRTLAEHIKKHLKISR